MLLPLLAWFTVQSACTYLEARELCVCTKSNAQKHGTWAKANGEQIYFFSFRFFVNMNEPDKTLDCGIFAMHIRLCGAFALTVRRYSMSICRLIIFRSFISGVVSGWLLLITDIGWERRRVCEFWMESLCAVACRLRRIFWTVTHWHNFPSNPIEIVFFFLF